MDMGKIADLPFGYGVLWAWWRLGSRQLLGGLLNLAGVPGFVRDCQYTATITDAHVSVQRSGVFTVVTVNGLDVYFHRLTGRIDGVGFSPAADCMQADTPESTGPVGILAAPPPPIRR